MEFKNFIVLADMPSKGKTQEASLSGEVILPLDTPLPVIVQGTGCIGLGVVFELRIRLDGTIVLYKLTRDIDNRSKEAYYNLYRNQVSSGGAEERYNADAVIPGAIGSLRGNSSRQRSAYMNDDIPSRRSRPTGLTDFLDDDDRAW